MPKRQTQRIIDNRSANRAATTISGVTLTAPAPGVSDHGLLLGLGDDDHPQYLLANGTRTLTGNLAVAANVTVDGVDISAHAANASAHHAPVTAGTLIEVSGQQVSVAPGSAQYQVPVTGASPFAPAWTALAAFAGAGLSFSGGQFAVGVANTGAAGLSVEADAIRLTTSSNPGAAASVLSTDANGYLQLRRLGLDTAPTNPLSVAGDANISGNAAIGSLSVSGAATVGQDFTVGANVLYVNQAGTRVGINRAPDQQFDLDVAGAIRGQYLIGKHAIQLSSAVGVWHYDGPAPYNLDFGGSDASHAGVGGTAAGGVIYRPGKFGKAVQVAPATTNLITNPSFETNTTGWGTDYPATTTLTRTAGGLYGDYYLAVAATGTGNFYSPAVTVANNTAYAASFWYRTTATVLVRVVEYGTSTNFGLATLPAAADWTRYTILLTTPASGSSTIRIGFSGLEAGESIDIDGVQVEQKAFASPYCDGSLGTGHSWSGTAHASTSSRTGATLQYATAGGLSVQAGTIQMWVRLDSYNGDGGGLFGSGANTEFDAYVSAAGVVVFRTDGNLLTYSTVPLGAWTHVAFTWNAAANSKKIYLNGVEVASTTYAATATLGSTLYVGSISAGSPYSVNGLIDEFVLLDYAADAKLIRAIYESDAPVFVESSVFHWRAPSRVPIWVDEYGLWARGVSGNEILGLYGGDPRNPSGNVTKSWGGITMEENDVLIGRAAGGYMHWDDSAQTLNLKGTMIVDGNSYLNGVVTVAAGGELRQGTGTIGSNYTGLRIWRDGDVGRIGGYNANTLQWYAGTDGKLYAGGGNVAINASGIAIAPNYDSTSLTFTNVGEIYALYDAGFGGTLYFRAGYNRSKESGVLLEAYSGTTVKSSLQLGANGIISAIGALSMTEMTAPSAPASNGAYIYLDDNGSGKTRLMVRFSSGSAVQLAIQP